MFYGKYILKTKAVKTHFTGLMGKKNNLKAVRVKKELEHY